jgi:alkylation response protein AidB-like acyl-CoA dehydrogenase
MAADMLVKAEVARAATYAAAVNLDGNGDDDLDRAVSVAKMLAGDAALFCGKIGIQIHGGMGFTWEVNAQRYWKRAVVLDTHYGNSEMHADALAGSM